MTPKNYLYTPSIDKYLGPDGNLYTDSDLDYMAKTESEWKESQPQYTLKQLLEIFPEAIASAKRALKKEVKEYKQKLIDVNTVQEDNYNDVISKAHFQDQQRLTKEADAYYDEMREGINSKISSNTYHLSSLGEQPKTMGGINETQIAEAKQIPITNFYTGKLTKRGERGTGQCPFHTEKTASFTVYLNQNSWYCYGCHTGGSVVDFLMLQQNIDFLSAVKQLVK